MKSINVHTSTHSHTYICSKQYTHWRIPFALFAATIHFWMYIHFWIHLSHVSQCQHRTFNDIIWSGEAFEDWTLYAWSEKAQKHCHVFINTCIGGIWLWFLIHNSPTESQDSYRGVWRGSIWLMDTRHEHDIQFLPFRWLPKGRFNCGKHTCFTSTRIRLAQVSCSCFVCCFVSHFPRWFSPTHCMAVTILLDTWIKNRRQALSLPPYFFYGGFADVNHNLYELSSWRYVRHGRQIIQTYAHMVRIIAAI